LKKFNPNRYHLKAQKLL